MENNQDIVFGFDEIEIPKSFHQLGVLVLDGSGSMTDKSASGNQTKAEAVHSAVKELLSRLKVSNNKNNFSMAVVTFDNQAKTHTKATPVVDIDDLADYNPLHGHGGGTNIPTALQHAKEIVREHIDQGKKAENAGIPHKAVLVVMSDGMSSGNPEMTAEEMKKEFGDDVLLCSTLFATKRASDPRAIEILKSIATDPAKNYITVYDAESLRKFFIASISSEVNA